MKFLFSVFFFFNLPLLSQENLDYKIDSSDQRTFITIPDKIRSIQFFINIYKDGSYEFGFQDQSKGKIEVKYTRNNSDQALTPKLMHYNTEGTPKALDFKDSIGSSCLWGNCKNGFGLSSNMTIFSLGYFINQSLSGIGIREDLDSALIIGDWKESSLNTFCMIVDIRKKYILVLKSDSGSKITILERRIFE